MTQSAFTRVPLLLWVAATVTVTDTTVQTYEALLGPLSLADKDRSAARGRARRG